MAHHRWLFPLQFLEVKHSRSDRAGKAVRHLNQDVASRCEWLVTCVVSGRKNAPNIQDVDHKPCGKKTSLNWINYQFERINPRGFWTWRADVWSHLYGSKVLWRDDHKLGSPVARWPLVYDGGRSATVWMNLDWGVVPKAHCPMVNLDSKPGRVDFSWFLLLF